MLLTPRFRASEFSYSRRITVVCSASSVQVSADDIKAWLMCGLAEEDEKIKEVKYIRKTYFLNESHFPYESVLHDRIQLPTTMP